MSEFKIETEQSKAHTYFAYDGDKIIAQLEIREYGHWGMFAHGLFVDKPYRGKGVAKSLIERAIADFGTQNIFGILAPFGDIDLEQDKLEQLYIRYGWQRVEDWQGEDRIAGVRPANNDMEAYNLASQDE